MSQAEVPSNLTGAYLATAVQQTVAAVCGFDCQFVLVRDIREIGDPPEPQPDLTPHMPTMFLFLSLSPLPISPRISHLSTLLNNSYAFFIFLILILYPTSPPSECCYSGPAKSLRARI